MRQGFAERLSAAALLAALGGSCETVPSGGPFSGPGLPAAVAALDPGFLVVRQYTDLMGPVAVLASGAEYRLINEPAGAPFAARQLDLRLFDPADPPLFRRDRPAPAPQNPPPDGAASAPGVDEGRLANAVFTQADAPVFLQANFPASVSLRAQQTPIRNQTGDACTWFAVTAAIEAAYRRDHGLDLDLSETHFNHLLKMALIEQGRALPLRENQIGAWGGGSVLTNLSWMETVRAGLPLQTLHPNAPNRNYSFPNPGDDPDLMNWALTGDTAQRVFDDFNLRDTSFGMKIPETLQWTPLPPAALAAARYRSAASQTAGGADIRSLDWYRAHLAAGREVVVQFACCDMFDNDAGRPAPPPGGAGTASHAAILVGYDDNAQTFQMKNSWGENDFRPYHYDNVTRGFVQAAAAITAIASPAGPYTAADNPAAFIGQWLLTDKGQAGLINGDAAGVLSIYNVPRATSTRLGTFHAQDGTQYRVNGALNGRVLNFWIDPANPDQGFSATGAGHRYQAMLFDDKRTIMTGRVAMGTGSFTRGFTARKVAPLSVQPVTRAAPPTASTVLKGYWAVETEGEIATLFFDRFDSARGQFIGFFEPAGGVRGNAFGVVNGDSVTITSDQNTLRIYFTFFANDAKTVLAGFYGGNPNSGFVAVLRHESAIVIPAIPGTLGPAPGQP